jgi:hypothetical protein
MSTHLREKAPPRRFVRGTTVLLALICTLWPQSPRAGESIPLQERQVELARQFDRYDFEPRPGEILSRDADFDGFPDYWRRIRGPQYREYPEVAIVSDPWRPGADPRAEEGHVLRMSYAGDEVAVETAVPREVNAQLAYEISAFARTEGLEHSTTSIDIVWLHIDEEGRSKVLGAPDQILVPRGQRDWSEAPLRRRINDIPPRTTHLRLVCRVQDDPDIPGADRHGVAFFDDIRIENRPKIAVNAMFRDDDRPLQIIIGYQGLTPNTGESGEADRQTRKQYARRIHVRDVHGEPVALLGEPEEAGGRRRIAPGNATIFTEEVILDDRRTPGPGGMRRQRGIFYMDVTLYGARREPLASVTEIVGRWAPPRWKPQFKRNPAALDHFGVGLDVLDRIDTLDPDSLLDVMRHLGVFRVKAEVWDDTPDGRISDRALHTAGDLMQRLREYGVRFTGVLGRLPLSLVPSEYMFATMRDRLDQLREAVRQPAMQLGPRIDDWRWGADDDPSFGDGVKPEVLAGARDALQDFTSAFVQALPLVLGSARELPPEDAAEAVSIYVPATMSTDEMLDELVRLLPTRFLQLTEWERALYPSDRLQQLSKRGEQILQAPERTRRIDDPEVERQYWLVLEPLALDPHLRDANAERAQVVYLTRKAALGRVLGFDRVFTGNLADPERGLVTVTRDRRIVPRPSLLAVRTLAEYLSGAEYLGSFYFSENIENYVFRSMREPENAVLVAWAHEGGDGSERVDIGSGWGALEQIDLAGNRRRIGRSFEVGPMPTIVRGISAASARTRMSIEILGDPPLRSITERHPQRLQIRNFHTEPLIGSVRLVYAARPALSGRGMRLEPGWGDVPEIRLNLPAGGAGPDNRTEAREEFDVRPTEESVLGKKFVRLDVRLAAASEMRFNMLRTTELTSDIDVRLRVLEQARDQRERVVRMTLRWSPNPNEPHPSRIVMQPYYQVAAERFNQGRMVLYPATEAQGWKGAAIRDVRIPAAFVGARVFVGAEEETGSRFLRHDVSQMLRTGSDAE